MCFGGAGFVAGVLLGLSGVVGAAEYSVGSLLVRTGLTLPQAVAVGGIGGVAAFLPAMLASACAMNAGVELKDAEMLKVDKKVVNVFVSGVGFLSHAALTGLAGRWAYNYLSEMGVGGEEAITTAPLQSMGTSLAGLGAFVAAGGALAGIGYGIYRLVNREAGCSPFYVESLEVGRVPGVREPRRPAPVYGGGYAGAVNGVSEIV